MNVSIEVRTLSLSPGLPVSRVDQFTVPVAHATAATRDRLVRGVEFNNGGDLFEAVIGDAAPVRGYMVFGRFSVIPKNEA